MQTRWYNTYQTQESSLMFCYNAITKVISNLGIEKYIDCISVHKGYTITIEYYVGFTSHTLEFNDFQLKNIDTRKGEMQKYKLESEIKVTLGDLQRHVLQRDASREKIAREVRKKMKCKL